MCHDLLNDASFWRLLSELDVQIAAEVCSEGCSCGGVLHSAVYPRKPRGVSREILGEHYEYRLSFCCNRQDCRRRCTPPSVRYLGRRVYLGVIVTLACAIQHGLTARRRAYLVERLSCDRHTMKRWLNWWREQLLSTPYWIALRGQLASPLSTSSLPDALLGVLQGEDLNARLIRFLALIMPLTTGSCALCPKVGLNPQRMPM